MTGSAAGSDWLADTRQSYDTVATAYADLRRDALAREPLVRGVLALFAELVRAAGGPVVDAGCGSGHLTAHLDALGLDATGVDLSPAMVAVARRDHPGLTFRVGSLTDLRLADSSAGGVLAWFSVIHIPDDEMPVALAHFHRVLRPGGVALLGFFVGDGDLVKTEGYGGYPMKVRVHRRPLGRVAAWLRDAGLAVEAEFLLDPDAAVPCGALLARRW